MKKLSASAAIWAGQAWINLPVFLIIFSPLALLGLLALPWLNRQPGTIAGPLLTFAFLVGVGSAWLWWSLMVPRWRIWAWSRVADTGDLRRRAVRHGLIWPEGHALERTEFRTAATRETFRELETKESPRD
jgi:hypothetical protein